MNHADHVELLGPALTRPAVWADLGAGAGAFTLALAELIGAAGSIYAVDVDRRALAELEDAMRARTPAVTLHVRAADFTRPLDLPPLDGIVMANSLHFEPDKERALQRVRGYLKPGGRLILVEYNVDRGNHWVPYPIAYSTWANLAARVGFAETRLLAMRPSRFLKEIYSAVSIAA
jgi:ubiquinone/menaquinone biosynthesis C-methylase UbiE